GGGYPRRRGRVAPFGVETAGRWSRVQRTSLLGEEQLAEAVAWMLLRRYGVVFRRLVERETLLVPWRDVLRVFRRLEARGAVRGGGAASPRWSAPIWGDAESALTFGLLRQIHRDNRQIPVRFENLEAPLLFALKRVLIRKQFLQLGVGKRFVQHRRVLPDERDPVVPAPIFGRVKARRLHGDLENVSQLHPPLRSEERRVGTA